MLYDNRKALPDNHSFTITDRNTGNVCSVTIEREISRGASCIVYRGIQNDHVGNKPISRTVIVKEFFPRSLDHAVIREDSLDILVPEKVQNRFQDRLDLFCEGQAKHIVFANKNAFRSLPPVFFFGEAHNTFYAISDPGQGNTLSELKKETLNLTDAFEIVASLCDAIYEIHNSRSLLYLDIKPDNIYVFNKAVYLFDFDTVQPKEKLRYCSFSDGWSAPEQVFSSDTGYEDVRRIGFHTDIYAVSMALLYLLIGKKPTSNDLAQIKTGFPWRDRIVLSDADEALEDDTFTKELSRVMRSTLEPDPDTRKLDYGKTDAAQKLKHELLHLIALAQNAPYRKGFADTKAQIDEAKDTIEDTIRKHSISAFLFGSKKRIAVTVSVFVVIAVVFGLLISLGGRITDTIVDDRSAELETTQDNHILLKLSNANHQYEVGLENWRRLDYNRAERDISAARSSISEQKAQSELDVARINNSLGCLYLDMGKYREAYDYLNSAYVVFRDTLGAESIEMRAVQRSIAQYYYSVGLLEEALTETQRILDQSDEKRDSAIIAGTTHIRAMIYDAQGRYDEALAAYDNVLQMYSDISVDGKLREQLSNYATDPQLSQQEKDYYTDAVRWIVFAYNCIATVNNHKGDYQAAVDAANTGLQMSLSNIYIGRRNITTSKLYMSLAIAQSALGRTKDAVDNIDLAMRIQRNLFDFQDRFPGLVKVFIAYGDVLLTQGKDSSAGEYYEDALKLAIDSFGENHPDTAAAYDALANYRLLFDDSQTSVEYLEKAIEIRKNILAENHPDTGKIYYDLAMAQRSAGRNREAMDSLRRAKDICEAWGTHNSLSDHIDTAMGQG